jgi:hypothetical protein
MYTSVSICTISSRPASMVTHGWLTRPDLCNPCLHVCPPAWCHCAQLDWFELYLRAQEERGYDGSFNMFMQLQVGMGTCMLTRSCPAWVCVGGGGCVGVGEGA